MGKKHTAVLNYALEYIARGWHIFPIYYMRDDNTCSCRNPKCQRPGKHPVSRKGFNAATTDEAQIRAWWDEDPNYNIGFCPSLSGLVGTDIDCGIDKKTGEPKVGRETWNALLADPSHQLPAGLSVLTGGGGEHLYFTTTRDIQKSEGRVGKDIDVRGYGGYLILPPSSHESGDNYRFKDGAAWREAADNMGEVPEWLAKLMEKPAAPSPAGPAVTARAAPGNEQSELRPDDPHDRLTLPQIQELLKPVPAGPRDNWITIGGTLKTIAHWFENGLAFEVWDEWAKTGEDYGGPDDQKYQWSSFPPTRVPPIALLRKLARESGWKPSEEFQKEARAHWKETAQRIMDALPDDAESDSDAVTALFRALSHLPELVRDDFLAKIRKRFKWRVAALRSEINRSQKRQASEADDEPSDIGLLVAQRVLVGEYDKLLIRPSDKFFWKYNGKHWEPIENGDEIVGDKCIDVIELFGQIPFAVSTVKNQAIDLLHSRCAREGDPLRLKSQLPPVINCLNGELWIQPDGTIKVQGHSPDSFLRFCLNINYDPEAECPLFDQAVLEIFAKSPNPEEMRRHLYEMFGYAIQPKRDMKQFWMWEGGGDNGKTGLADTLQKMIGDAATFSIKFSKVDSDYNLSAIKQCLLVRDNDIDWRTVLPDGIVKQLSEDASLTGRDPYGKPTGFKNCSLPLLLCNKYPMTKDLSHAVQVRAHVIPFRRIFIKNQDMKRGLFEQIWKSELPGILRRSIEGLQRLRERGEYLEPEDCLFAKQEFLRQANPLPRFIAEACVSNSTPFEKIRQQARLVVLRLHFDNAEQLLPFESHGEGMESVDSLIAVAMAKAETEQPQEPLTDFYKHFWQWTRNEGIQMAHKPTRADVENYLINLGYAIKTVENQKWVDGVRAFPQVDQRPVDGM